MKKIDLEEKLYKKELVRLVKKGKNLIIKDTGREVNPIPIGIPEAIFIYRKGERSEPRTWKLKDMEREFIFRRAPKITNSYIIGIRRNATVECYGLVGRCQIEGYFLPIQYYKI